MLIYAWCDFRLSWQRNWLRKPIHVPYMVMSISRWGTTALRMAGAAKSSLAISFPFFISICLLEGETGYWKGNQFLFADSDLHPGALLPSGLLLAASVSCSWSQQPQIPVIAATMVPGICMLSLISAIRQCLGRLHYREWQTHLMRENSSLQKQEGTVKQFLTLKSWSWPLLSDSLTACRTWTQGLYCCSDPFPGPQEPILLTSQEASSVTTVHVWQSGEGAASAGGGTATEKTCGYALCSLPWSV